MARRKGQVKRASPFGEKRVPTPKFDAFHRGEWSFGLPETRIRELSINGPMRASWLRQWITGEGP